MSTSLIITVNTAMMRFAHFSEKYSNLIVDNVQAFYTPPIKGLDTIYTCRKFFGVPDEAYLYTDCILTESIPYDKSYDRLAFFSWSSRMFRQ